SSESEVSLKRKSSRLLEAFQELASEVSLKRKSSRLLEAFQELAGSWGSPESPQSQSLRGALDRKSQELQRSLDRLGELQAAKEQLEERLGHLEQQLLAQSDPGGDPRGDPDTQGLLQDLQELHEQLEEFLVS
ncbi:hypothetical protein HGM15179_021664, partial [Zosterops borbonicus]